MPAPSGDTTDTPEHRPTCSLDSGARTLAHAVLYLLRGSRLATLTQLQVMDTGLGRRASCAPEKLLRLRVETPRPGRRLCSQPTAPAPGSQRGLCTLPSGASAALAFAGTPGSKGSCRRARAKGRGRPLLGQTAWGTSQPRREERAAFQEGGGRPCWLRGGGQEGAS